MLLTLIPIMGCTLSYRDCLWIYESPCFPRAGRPFHANILSKFWSSALRGCASSGIANDYCDATYASHKIPSLKEPITKDNVFSYLGIAVSCTWAILAFDEDCALGLH